MGRRESMKAIGRAREREREREADRIYFRVGQIYSLSLRGTAAVFTKAPLPVLTNTHRHTHTHSNTQTYAHTRTQVHTHNTGQFG